MLTSNRQFNGGDFEDLSRPHQKHLKIMKIHRKKHGFSVPLEEWGNSKLPILKSYKKTIQTDHFDYKMAWSNYILDEFLKKNR